MEAAELETLIQRRDDVLPRWTWGEFIGQR